jgi:hypothetical protein
MNYNDNTEVWGITDAAKIANMTIGAFYYYYKRNRTPTYRMERNKPTWNIDALKNWKPILKGRGRPRKFIA